MELTGCAVDLARGKVVRGDRTADLTSRELDLLRYLAANPARVVTRDELLAEVWGYRDSVVSRACDNTVRRLREKIEADPAQPDHLLTVHGEGYRFEPAVAPVAAPVDAPAAWWTDLGPARVDLRRRLVEGPSGAQRLTEAEARGLEALVHANGAVVERNELNRAAGTRGRAVDALIGQLRAKLEVDRSRPRLLVTHRGGGYRLERSVAAPDALIGRAALVEQVRRAHEAVGWVLVLGPAGVGKSRLARQVAPSAVRVGLAAARTPAEATERVAAALGLALADPDELADALALRQGLVLVLDDLEAVPQAAVLIDRWRERAPNVRWLGTSRSRVGARDERVVEVGPLEPDDAVELFVRRAQAASSAGPIADLAAVREIVDRLDRMPLAIELAAARTSTLGLADLGRRLSTALLVRPPGGDPRHHSLAAVVRSSLDAVPADALGALEQLALFRSGFYVDDAEALLGEDAIDLVQLLRDHSLLHRLPDLEGAARFDTWQAVREVLGDPAPERVRRHAAHLGRGADDPDRIDALGREAELRRTFVQVDDLRLAALLALPLDPALAARCAIVAGTVYVLRGPQPIGLELLDPVVDTLPPGRDRARLRFLRGQLLVLTGAAEAGQSELRAAAEEAGASDEPGVEGPAWRVLGYQRERFGDPDGARACYERALAVARRGGLGDGLPELFAATLAPTAEERLAGYRDAARVARGAGQRTVLTSALIRLAHEAEIHEGPAEARRALETVYALAESAGLEGEMLQAANRLARLAQGQDDAAGIERWAAVMAPLADRVGSRVYRMRVRTAQAGVAAARGRWAESDALAAEAAALADAGPEGQLELARLDLVRAEAALQGGDFTRAAARALSSQAGSRAAYDVAAGHVIEGLAAIGLGDLERARSSLGWDHEEAREYGLALRALLAAAEGRVADARRELEALEVELRRIGRPARDTDAERIAQVAGRWAVERLARALGSGKG